jgi:Zn-dependent protease with chaperone function
VEDRSTDATPAPAAQPPSAIYFDGVSNRKHVVTVRLGEHALDLIENGSGVASWSYDGLRKASSAPGMLRLANVSALPLARLEVRDVTLRDEILARCSALKDDPAATRNQTGRILAWSSAAIVSVVLVVLYGMPLLAERLTPLMPYWLEQRMGDAGEQQIKLLFGRRTCANAGGKAAFDKLVSALKQAGGIESELRTEVLASTEKNAFALAGGKIYLLSGLLDAAQSVDELAGVLAHELGHVGHRDHVRRMIYNGGTSFLIGLLFGDISGSGAAIFATQTLLESSYSRDAETNADNFAVTVMHKLGRSPQPLGEFLYRLTGSQESRRDILASHPMTDARLRAMIAAHRPNTGPDLLTPAEWQALKAICR